MIRIGLYSEDRTLQPLLSSALGRQFSVLLESTEDGIDRILTAGDCDVLVLDLDARQDSLKQQILSCRRMIETRVPAVIMAEDGLRSTALDLVRLGAYGYCRRPPSIRELKTLL